MLLISLIPLIFLFFYGIWLYRKDKEKFNTRKSLIEYLMILFTVIITLININGSTNDFKNVIQRFDKIIDDISREPNLEISFNIDPNDTTYEITAIKLQNKGKLTANVYKMKIEMPSKGLMRNETPNGFYKVFTYDKKNLTYQMEFNPPVSVLTSPSILLFRCEFVYDKHINLPFHVNVYYNAEYGHDGMKDTTITIYKE
jgi:hypothetical protein